MPGLRVTSEPPTRSGPLDSSGYPYGAMRPGQRLLFVGGLHRSGTTPVARLLAAHPKVSGLRETGVSEDEGQHLQSVYPRIRAYGGMGRFANDDRAHLTEASPLVSHDSARRLVAAWQPYWDLSRPLLLEKSPSNVVMTRFLQALFPDASFVMVMRHPVVVALAMQKWNPTVVARNGRRRVSLRGLVAHWVRAYELLAQDAPHVANLHVVRYEDLVSDPTSELAKIQWHLHLSSPLDAASVRPDLSTAYREQWAAMLTSGALARRRRRAIEDVFGGSLERFGYDVETLAARPEWSLPTL